MRKSTKNKAIKLLNSGEEDIFVCSARGYGKQALINELKARGGARIGSGRKPAPYKTTTVSFRVRVEIIQDVKDAVKAVISQFNKNNS
jgi:hypothetical protein